jgi:hypothetical protein
MVVILGHYHLPVVFPCILNGRQTLCHGLHVTLASLTYLISYHVPPLLLFSCHTGFMSPEHAKLDPISGLCLFPESPPLIIGWRFATYHPGLA